MRIAFVNQPFDVIVPPCQSSIGLYTYAVGRLLARSSEVVVYGLHDPHAKDALQLCDPGLNLHLFRSGRVDRFVFRTQRHLSNMVQMSSPMSSSDRLFPQYGKRVARDLQLQECDIIHIHHSSQFAPAIRALNPKAKIILQLHGVWQPQSNFKTLGHRLESVDLLLTVSDYLTEKIKRDFPAIADRCETTPCGVDPEEFSREKDYWLGRQRKEKVILYSGAVSPHRGSHILLDAFNIVIKQFPNVRLELAGLVENYPMEEVFDLKDRSVITEVAPFYAKHPISYVKGKLGLGRKSAGIYQAHLNGKLTPEVAKQVTFTGFLRRPDLLKRYHDADIFVFPTICGEGFGIPLVEGMAAGLPAVGTRAGAVPEIVEDGVTGFLVEKNDVRALAERILKLLRDDDLRESMGRAARRHVLETFTWERAADSLESRYHRLLNEQPFDIDKEVQASVAI